MQSIYTDGSMKGQAFNYAKPYIHWIIGFDPLNTADRATFVIQRRIIGPYIDTLQLISIN